MFSEALGSRKTIGDVDIVYHDGLYHLFHLVLPNHDFIAHAISENALNWRRVNNAIFVGHPGSWDDLMLWTMHVSRDPHREGGWRMFYTGLSRRDRGLKQRIGMAISDDLFHWEKCAVNWHDMRGEFDPPAVKAARAKLVSSEASSIQAPLDESSSFPLEPNADHYESSINEGRHWVSFRDPYYYRDGSKGWLLVAGRVNDGPIVRRGCVSVLKEVAPNQFESRPPLHHPGLYDDIEVPNLFRLDGEYYLVGSIREDAKIRYWHTDRIGNPWRAYHDNVLLPKGNYAGRICHDDRGILLWNFFTEDNRDRTSNNLMPPPKRLARLPNGQLLTQTFEGFDALDGPNVDTRCMKTLKSTTPHEVCRIGSEWLELASEAGFQGFVFDEMLGCFRLHAKLALQGLGKCGILFRIDPFTHDGYYLSLDMQKGVAQLRAWGTNKEETGEHMMQFRSLQAGFWESSHPLEVDVKLLAFGSYIELMINDRVILSLADQTFHHGMVGFYIESAKVRISHVNLNHLPPPAQSDEHLAHG